MQYFFWFAKPQGGEKGDLHRHGSIRAQDLLYAFNYSFLQPRFIGVDTLGVDLHNHLVVD